MKKIKYIAMLLCAMFTLEGAAQTAKSAYFLDGAYHNYHMNPAMKPERGFFAVGIGNLGFGTQGNVGLSNFLYPVGDNKLTTFMSGSVAADDFLSAMPDAANLGFNLDENILAMGIRMFGGYTTLGVSLHSATSLSLPKGFFEFAKNGLQQSSHSFSGINMHTMNYASATLGYSHEIFKGFRLGVNAKYLIGLAYADITVDKLNLELGENHWMAESHAQAHIGAGIEVSPTVDEEGLITGFEMGPIAPSASGLAFDLGIVYDMDHIVPGLTLSASVVDMGKITWKHMMKGQSTDAKVEFNGFEEIDPNDVESSLNAELERLTNDASKMVEYTYEGTEAMSTKLNTTMYLGAEWKFCKPLGIGVLYGQRFTQSTFNKWHEVRGYLNFTPCRWLEASANYGTTSYGTSLGWMFNFHPAGITFFVGSDYMITKVTPQFIPVDDLNAHITLGVNLALGKRK